MTAIQYAEKQAKTRGIVIAAMCRHQLADGSLASPQYGPLYYHLWNHLLACCSHCDCGRLNEFPRYHERLALQP